MSILYLKMSGSRWVFGGHKLTVFNLKTLFFKMGSTEESNPMQNVKKIDLTEVGTHYEFGKNWETYSSQLDESRISSARSRLESIIGKENLLNKTLLDIGSGSGLHSVAACRLGARHVTAIDIDEVSTATTSASLAKFAPESDTDCKTLSILAPESSDLGLFDIVYSWGVLHHTGSLWEAIHKASTHVAPKGLFVIAIYRKSLTCWLWKYEKKLFTNSGSLTRSFLRGLFKLGFKIACLIKGRRFSQIVADYKTKRGMDWHVDVDDWLGGYPYESATADEITDFVVPIGFSLEQVVVSNTWFGMFGVGCSEFRFRRIEQQ